MDIQLLTIISTLAGTMIGSGITMGGIILNNHFFTKQEKIKRKRALLDELRDLCFRTEKLFIEAIDGNYPIHEFSFSSLEETKSRIVAIIIMDFEESLYDTYSEFADAITTLQTSIEEFHALYVANPSLDDPLIKSKREENTKLNNELLINIVTFIRKIKKVSEKL